MIYTPAHWYWYVGGDHTQVFSSASNAYVPISDATFVAWGGTPTHIDTFENLKAVLLAANVSPYLTVTPRQARLALLGAGLLAQVEAAVAQAGGAAQITWDFATEVNRLDPFIISIGGALGMSSAQIDALFEAAKTL